MRAVRRGLHRDLFSDPLFSDPSFGVRGEGVNFAAMAVAVIGTPTRLFFDLLVGVRGGVNFAAMAVAVIGMRSSAVFTWGGVSIAFATWRCRVVVFGARRTEDGGRRTPAGLASPDAAELLRP